MIKTIGAETAIPHVSVWKSPVSSIAIGSNSLGDMAGNKESHQVTSHCLNSEHAELSHQTVTVCVTNKDTAQVPRTS